MEFVNHTESTSAVVGNDSFAFALLFTAICFFVVISVIVIVLAGLTCGKLECCCCYLIGWIGLGFLKCYRQCCGPCDRGAKRLLRMTQGFAKLLRIEQDDDPEDGWFDLDPIDEPIVVQTPDTVVVLQEVDWPVAPGESHSNVPIRPPGKAD